MPPVAWRCLNSEQDQTLFHVGTYTASEDVLHKKVVWIHKTKIFWPCFVDPGEELKSADSIKDCTCDVMLSENQPSSHFQLYQVNYL